MRTLTRSFFLSLILAGAAAYGQQQTTPAGDVGHGTADLVTLHPLNAAGNVGKGVGVGAKDAGVGAAKGTGKIAKGTGRGVKHLFKHDPKEPKQPSAETSSSSY
jgi:hypothetical protein